MSFVIAGSPKLGGILNASEKFATHRISDLCSVTKQINRTWHQSTFGLHAPCLRMRCVQVFIASGASRWSKMAAEFPDLVIRSHSDLADALARVKNFLQLSNETVEAVSGLAKGHCDKLLGPSRCKRIGPLAFDLLLGTLGIKLRVEVDLEQAQKMAARWERRQEMQVRLEKLGRWS